MAMYFIASNIVIIKNLTCTDSIRICTDCINCIKKLRPGSSSIYSKPLSNHISTALLHFFLAQFASIISSAGSFS